MERRGMEQKEFIEIPIRQDINVEGALEIKKSATEKTLQSIDATLKRIEVILLDQQKSQSYALDVRRPSLPK